MHVNVSSRQFHDYHFVERVRSILRAHVNADHPVTWGMPADAALWSPTARLVDPDGEVFDAINAPVPVGPNSLWPVST